MNDFENAMVDMLREASQLYAKEHASEPVYQIAIWTAETFTLSSFGLETEVSASEFIQKAALFWLQNDDEQTAVQIELGKINYNPADFLYKDFATLHHPWLRTSLLDSAELIESPEKRVEEALISIRKKCIGDRIFDMLPNNGFIWIGSSSELDWYDHVEKYVIES